MQLSTEDFNLVSDSVQNKTQPITENEKQLVLNRVQEKSVFEYTPAYQSIPQFHQPVINNSRDLFEEATRPIVELDENASDLDKIRYENDLKNRREAQSILDFYRYRIEDKDNSDLRGRREELIRTYGTDILYATDEQKKQLIKDIDNKLAMEEYKKILDNNNVPFAYIINDIELARNINPQTLKTFSVAYNLANDNGNWGLALDRARANRVNDFDYVDYAYGENNNAEHRFRQQYISSRYAKDFEEHDTLDGVMNSITYMYKPIVDNPLRSAVALGLAGLTAYFTKGRSPGLVSAVFFGISMAPDVNKQLMAQGLADGYNSLSTDGNIIEFGEEEHKEFKSNLLPYTLAGTSLEVLSDSLGLKLSGLLDFGFDATKKVAMKKLTTNIANRVGANADKKVAQNLSQKVGPALKVVGIEYPGVVAAETSTESLQDVIVGVGTDKNILKINNTDELISKALDRAKGTAVDSLSSIAITSALMMSPKTIVSLTDTLTSASDNDQVARTLLANGVTQLNNTIDPVTNSNITNRILHQDFKANRQDIINELQRNGLTTDNLTEDVRALLDDNQGQQNLGDSVTISQSQWASQSNEVQLALSQTLTTDDNMNAPLRSQITEENINELLEQMQIEREVFNQEQQIEQDIQAEVVNSILDSGNTNFTARERTTIASVTSSFFRAMSKITGVNALDLYRQYNLNVENVNGINTGNANDMTSNNVLGAYNNSTRTIQIKNLSDFGTLTHEIGHYFLDVMINLSKTNADIKAKLDTLVTKLGIATDINSLTDEQYTKLQENFVSSFIANMIRGGNKVDTDIFNSFGRLLSSLKNSSLFELLNRQDLSKQSKAEYLTQGMIDTEVNEFNTLINSMFVKDVLSEYQESSYSTTNILQAIEELDTGDNGIVNNLKEQLSDLLVKEMRTLDNANNQMIMQQALTSMIGAKRLGKFIDDIVNNLPESITNKRDVVSFLNKVKSANEKYNRLVEQIKKDLEKNDTVYLFAQRLNNFNINFNSLNLTKEQQQALKRFDLWGEDGNKDSSTILTDLIDAIKDTIPREIINTINGYITKNNLTEEQAYIKLFTDNKTPLQQAQEQARRIALNGFNNTHKDALLKVTATQSALHKKLGKIFLDTLKSFTDARDMKTNKIIGDIETLAEFNVRDTRLRDADEKSYMSNASKCNRRMLENVARNDLEGAVKESRNEIYQNHKALYISNWKRDFIKQMAKFKQLVKRTRKDAKLVRRDGDIVDVMQSLMYRVGLVNKPPVNSIEESINHSLLQNNQLKDLFDNVLNVYREYQNVTDYTQLSINDLNKLTDLLTDLDTLSREQMEVTLNDRHISYESQVECTLRNTNDINKKKDKVVIDEQNNTAGQSAKKTTLWEKIKTEYRKYKALTDQVEHILMRIEGSSYQGITIDEVDNNGTLEKVVYGTVLQENFRAIKNAVAKVKLMINDDYRAIQIALNNAYRSTKGKQRDVINTGLYIAGDGVNGKQLVLAQRGSVTEGDNTNELLGLMLNMGTNYRLMLENNFIDNEQVSRDTLEECIRLNIVEVDNANNIIRGHTEFNKRLKRNQYNYKDNEFRKFIQRMCDEGYITSEMWDYCETVWQRYKLHESALEYATRRIRGYGLKIEQGQDVTVNIDGKQRTVKAGYCPAFVNQNLTAPRQKRVMDLDSEFNPSDNLNLMQSPSMTIERDANRTAPVSIDNLYMVGQLSKVIRYSELASNIYQFHRLMEDPRMIERIENVAPGFRENVLKPYFKDMLEMRKTEDIYSGYIRFAGAIARRSSQAIMCGNLKNTIEQIANIPMLWAKHPVKCFAQALIYVAKNPKKAIEEMQNESSVMFVRRNETINGINENFIELNINAMYLDSMNKKLQALNKSHSLFMDKTAMITQKSFQNQLDVIAYYTAKFDALEQGMSDNDAIGYSEQTVRECMGSFDKEDSVRMQRINPVARSLFMFGTYFYQMANLLSTRLNIVWRKYDIKNPKRYINSAYVIGCNLIIPSMIAEVVASLVGRNDFGDDDDKEWYQSVYLLAPFKMWCQQFPVVNNIISEGIDRLQGNSYYQSTYLKSPVFTIIDSSSNATKKIFTDGFDELKARDVMAVSEVLAIITGTPFVATLGRPIATDVDRSNGFSDSNDIYENIRAYMTGSPKKEK